MAGVVWWTDFCGNRSEFDSFWSSALTVDTFSPCFTRCFENTVLVWTPAVFLWVVSPFYLYNIRRGANVHGACNNSVLNKIKVVGAILLAILSCVDLIWSSTQESRLPLPPSDLVAPIVSVVTMSLMAGIMALEFQKGMHTSVVGFLFWLLTFITGIFKFASGLTKLIVFIGEINVVLFTSFLLSFVLITVEFFLQLWADNKASVSDKLNLQGTEREPLLSLPKQRSSKEQDGKPEKEITPAARVSYFNYIMFGWCTSFIFKGYKRPLTFDDIYKLEPEYTTEVVMPTFEKNWDKDLSNCGIRNFTDSGQEQKSSRTPSLFFTVFKQISWLIAMSNIGRLFSIAFDFASPLILRALIAYINSGNVYTWQGVLIALSFVVANFMSVMMINYVFLWPGYLAGFKLRTLVTAAVYRKAMRLSSATRRHTTVGEIVNLMSVDAQKCQDMTTYYELTWSIPVTIALCLYFLYQTIGAACFAGLAILILIIPLNAMYIGNKVRTLQRDQMKKKDLRVKLISEMLSGIKVLKLYAWEPSFEGRVRDIRNEEIRLLRLSSILQAVSSAVWFLAPYLVSLAIFATYILISPENVLDADKAFVSLSLINLLNFPMSLLPFAVSNVAQAVVSVKRVRKFLLSEELDQNAVGRKLHLGEVISFRNATCSWGANEPPVLKTVNLDITRGKLVAIVGAVGSGKSSLVSAMLGDLHRSQGSIDVLESLAYVPQQAWIQNATLRDNILFGKPYDRVDYNRVIDACCLRSDLKVLTDGDLTEIGEKGINISGGQKQRVSLARAVYQNKDLYIMDDTLSAVDVHVGKHIFDEVIGPSGLLKNKTRVLVTHGVNFLPRVDMIVVMENGRISEIGPYEALLEANNRFAEFIRTYLTEINSDDETDQEVLDDLQRRISTLSEKSDNDVEDGHRKAKQRPRKRNVMRSVSSKSDDGKEEKVQQPLKLIEEETSESGSIGFSVILSYIKAGGVTLMFLVTIFYCLVIAAQVLTNLWLTDWSDDATNNKTSHDQNAFRLSVYGYFGIAQVVTSFVSSIIVGIGTINASRTMHNTMLHRILRAPMAFFDTTPLGRIINRMAKDLDVMDTNMPLWALWFLFTNIPVITTIIIISYSTPLFLVVAVPLFIAFFFIQRLYVTSARQLKRIDSVRRSPLYVHFDESLVGSSVIRAYRRQQDFTDKCDRLLDESQMTYYQLLASYRWLGVNVPLLGVWVVFFASLFAVISRDSMSASVAALSVTYALQITTYLRTSIRVASEFETAIVAVERVHEYSEVTSEAPWNAGEILHDPNWPTAGKIEFNKFSLRYRPGLDLVLKDIECQINPGEKIGIVGRTGAGKSSLTLALFRIIEAASGNISIDGVDSSKIGLHELRHNVTIIPQDPVIFSGTLRENLDPFNRYSSQEVMQALTHAHLKETVECLDGGLDYECGEGGEALSVGQRQLLCLARALLRKNKILVLDEATAAVDMRTDDLIQSTIRNSFKDCTIITIAHRISTITDYDRVMVLNKGVIQEFDRPAVLLQNKRSLFHGLAREAGLA